MEDEINQKDLVLEIIGFIFILSCLLMCVPLCYNKLKTSSNTRPDLEMSDFDETLPPYTPKEDDNDSNPSPAS